MGDFDIEAARKAGISDEEIARALAAHRGEDPSSVDDAYKAGHSFTDIANHLAGGSQRGDYEGDPTEAAILGGVAGAVGSGAAGTYHVGHDILNRIVKGPAPQAAPAPQVAPAAEPAPQVAPEAAVKPIEIPPESSVEDLVGKEKWNTKLTGASAPGSQMDAASLAKNKNLMNAARDVGGSLSDQGIILGPKETHANRVAQDALTRARQARVEAALHDAQLQQEARVAAQIKAADAAKVAKAAEEAKLANRVKTVASGVNKAVQPVTNAISKVANIPVVGHALAAAGTAGEAQDAYNRAQHGDYGRALISGLGAAGSAATLLPNPVVKGLGGAAALSAPAINALIDKYYGREGYAGGGKVGAIQSLAENAPKIFESAKSIITPKRSVITDVMNTIRNNRGNYAANRVEHAADLVPNLEHQYSQQALENAFNRSNPQALTVINPAHFEEYAEPLSPINIGSKSLYEPHAFKENPNMTYDQYIDHLANIARSSGFSEVPKLHLDETLSGDLRIGGHEGRHRTRALSQLGDNSTLIQLEPGYSLTDGESRQNTIDYIKALNNRIGSNPIQPEIFPNAKVHLPNVFKRGGATTPAQMKQELLAVTGSYPALRR
jgi:hypothetical protein